MSVPFWLDPHVLDTSSDKSAFEQLVKMIASKAVGDRRANRTAYGNMRRYSVKYQEPVNLAKRVLEHVPGHFVIEFLYEHHFSCVKVSDDTVAELIVNITNKNLFVTLTVYSLSRELMDKIVLSTDSLLHEEAVETNASFLVMVNGTSGTDFTPLYCPKQPLIEDNYRTEVVSAYRHVCADLESESPCGRLSIFNGVPGTGKTHLVKAMLTALPKIAFVFIPSNYIDQLSSPSFLPNFINIKNKPIVLIIEDADEAVSKRDAANQSQISALLNLSDGLFGSALDVRVIVTTNLKVGEVDDAVLRSGRLCRRIDVKPLGFEQACRVLKRLHGGKDESKKLLGGPQFTLGEIYSAVRSDGETVEKSPRTGFVK